MKKVDVVYGAKQRDCICKGVDSVLTIEVRFEKEKGFYWINEVVDKKTKEVIQYKESKKVPFMVMFEEFGSIKVVEYSLSTIDEFISFVDFLKENDLVFTEEQSSFIWIELISKVRQMALSSSQLGLNYISFIKKAKLKEIIKLSESNYSILEIRKINFELKEFITNIK